MAEPSAHYVNAKVVLVGDTGVGKSGLSLVLNNQPFEATDSTPGRRVWTFDSREVEVGDNVTQTRETLLWDLAGQPGYRVIHQLHLNEVAVALVVFDARSETDPLAGVRHWERALRLAQQRQGTSGVPMKKFLVSARNDRGGVSIGEDRLQAILKEFGFDGYFKTSAKEGWEIKELRAAIEQAIEWEELPEVSSSQLFADIKSFLLEVKKTGRLLAPAGQLYDEFVRQHPDTAAKVANLRDQFDTCIGRLENRDLIRRLTFGGYVLLQPELLDAYASAMVNTAKEEPDGLGSLAEEIALAGKFFVPKEQKVTDPGQEQLLLHATVEELVRHDLALRENADDGRYLVFPSQFNRDYEDAPEPKGKAVAITFDGPVQSLYSTLAVRLGHSGLFTTGRAEMWRNAAVFTAKAGGKCGLFLHEFAEGRGRLILFFPDEHSSAETRFHFEEFVLAHAKRRALDGTVELVRFFVCPDCGDPVPDSYVKRLREKGKMEFNCPCGGTVSLAEPKERIHFRSKVEAMDRSADGQRDFDAFVMSAKGETSTKSFQDWAGGEQVTLAIVFTDVVGSTALGEEIRDEAMNEVRRAHFAQSRRLIGQFQGREIKTIGDSFMAAFKCVGRGAGLRAGVAGEHRPSAGANPRRHPHRADARGGRRCVRRHGELRRPRGRSHQSRAAFPGSRHAPARIGRGLAGLRPTPESIARIRTSRVATIEARACWRPVNQLISDFFKHNGRYGLARSNGKRDIGRDSKGRRRIPGRRSIPTRKREHGNGEEGARHVVVGVRRGGVDHQHPGLGGGRRGQDRQGRDDLGRPRRTVRHVAGVISGKAERNEPGIPTLDKVVGLKYESDFELWLPAAGNGRFWFSVLNRGNDMGGLRDGILRSRRGVRLVRLAGQECGSRPSRS